MFLGSLNGRGGFPLSISIPNQRFVRTGDDVIGMLASANIANIDPSSLVAIAQHIQNNVGFQYTSGVLAEIFVAVIDSPDDGETAFTNANYHLVRQKVFTDTSDSDQNPDVDNEDIPGLQQRVVGLNLSEFNTQSHTLPEDQSVYVLVFGFDSRNGTGKRQYVFGGGGGGESGFWAQVGTGELKADEEARWDYPLSEIDNNLWLLNSKAQLLTDGRSVTGTNVWENPNPSSGIGEMGSGHTISDADFANGQKLKPVTPGTVVWVRTGIFCVGSGSGSGSGSGVTTIYTFEAPNGKVECPS